MSQSCETLITKINEWQKAILELERLAGKFLGTGDESLKAEVDVIRQKIRMLTEEYQGSAYPELSNGEKLFWVEKELLVELFKHEPIVLNHIKRGKITIKDNHVYDLRVGIIDLKTNLSLFNKLNIVHFNSFPEQFPLLPKFIKQIWVLPSNFSNAEIKKIQEEYPSALIYVLQQ